jgi:DNA topoisomerase IB
MPRIRRVDTSSVGLTRRRAGRGFTYLDTRGERIADAATLARIKGLVIPPAWRDVWISPVPNGHIQAVGTDAAGRRQYLYHPAWRARREAAKFDQMLDFAKVLPAVRDQVAADLALEGMPAGRVLACAVRLIDRGFFRIGGETYAERNHSYGLATITKEHVSVDGGVLTFDYAAKHGQRRVVQLTDPEVLPIVVTLLRRRGGGDELLAWRDGRTWRDLRSADVNRYIKLVTGDERHSAKEFRTWSATVLAAVGLAVTAAGTRSRTARTRAIARVVKEVAAYLGNTPAIARGSYIDPRVVDAYQSGLTIADAIDALGDVGQPGEPSFQGKVEQAVVDLIAERKGASLEDVVPGA